MDQNIAFSLFSVGDISFMGQYSDSPSIDLMQPLLPVFRQADFLLGNLESPLTLTPIGAVQGKCCLRGTTSWATVLKQWRFDLVSLANNHMMDYGRDGLVSTIEALEREGIAYVGAGLDIESATKPAIMTICGKNVAFLGRCSVDVSSPCYASKDNPGVAYLDAEELSSTIKDIRKSVDMIVVLLHWGLEHYQYPSPQQRIIANEIVSAGADIILGHHPHVLHGHESIGKSIVSYSSGNFVFDEFSWSLSNSDGSLTNIHTKLSPENRKGMIFVIQSHHGGELKAKQLFTSISDDSTVNIDNSKKRLIHYKKLCNRLNLSFYSTFWKLHSLKMEWDLRIRHIISPINILKNIHKVRLRHFKELFSMISRSARITSGKSTNPYE